MVLKTRSTKDNIQQKKEFLRTVFFVLKKRIEFEFEFFYLVILDRSLFSCVRLASKKKNKMNFYKRKLHQV